MLAESILSNEDRRAKGKGRGVKGKGQGGGLRGVGRGGQYRRVERGFMHRGGGEREREGGRERGGWTVG